MSKTLIWKYSQFQLPFAFRKMNKSVYYIKIGNDAQKAKIIKTKIIQLFNHDSNYLRQEDHQQKKLMKYLNLNI